MTKVLSIAFTLLIFETIVVIHEFGHFIVARKNGVRVNEFAIGMGPAIFKKQGKETLFALRVVPFGGYCAMEGEESADGADPDRAFCNKRVTQKIAIIIAGVVMNFLLAFVLQVVSTCISGDITSTKISSFYDDAVSNTGSTPLMKGDKIVSVNGMRIFTQMDIIYQFRNDPDGVFDMVVKRDGEKVELDNVTFTLRGDDGKSLYIDFTVYPVKRNPLTVTAESFRQMLTNGRLIYISLFDMVRGKYSLKDISGPVGVVEEIDDVIVSRTDEQKGIDWGELSKDMLFLAILLSTNIGIFNLLPLPALDGGRLIFLLIELVRRKPVDQKYEGMVHLVGMALLLGFMLVVTVSDVTKLFN